MKRRNQESAKGERVGGAANLGYRFYGYNLDRFYNCGAEIIAA